MTVTNAKFWCCANDRCTENTDHENVVGISQVQTADNALTFRERTTMCSLTQLLRQKHRAKQKLEHIVRIRGYLENKYVFNIIILGVIPNYWSCAIILAGFGKDCRCHRSVYSSHQDSKDSDAGSTIALFPTSFRGEKVDKYVKEEDKQRSWGVLGHFRL
jgi:hypothetical protein